MSYGILFIIVFITTIFIFVAGITMMRSMNGALFDAGNSLMNQTIGYANQINTPAVKSAMLNITSGVQASYITGKPMLDKFVQYGWIFVILVISFVILVLARKAERRGTGLI